jgi:hypothetical protein
MIVLICILVLIILLILYEYKTNYFRYNAIYEKNIYSKKIFDKILLLCNEIKTENMELDDKASKRLMYVFKKDDPKTKLIKELIFNKEFIEKIRKLIGNDRLVPYLKIPIEYRKYQKDAYMKWHRDTKMLKDQLQYECVITLTNTSDSLTLLDKILYWDKISTEPNSILIVRARGIRHMVTKTINGSRTILKFVFYQPK